MIPKHVLHLLSGGIDSTVMLYDLHSQGCNIHCLLFDYGQVHVQELVWARHHCHKLNFLYNTFGIPELRGSELTGDKGGVVVPNRNAIFLSLAVNWAIHVKAECITYACNHDDAKVFPDCTKEFVEAYNSMLKASKIPVEICVPYIDKAKWQIVELGKKLEIKFEETWSCYRGGTEACGECLACKNRNEALVPRWGYEGVSVAP